MVVYIFWQFFPNIDQVGDVRDITICNLAVADIIPTILIMIIYTICV